VHTAERDWLGTQPGGAATIALWLGSAGDIRLTSAGTDGTIRICDLVTGASIGRPLTGHAGAVWGLTSWVDTEGRVRLASAGDDGTVRIWDPEAGTALGAPLTGHVGWVRALTTLVGPEGRVRLASAGDDGTVRIWDPEAGTALGAPLTGHVGWVRALTSWTADDGAVRLASAGNDGIVRVWDADTGQAQAQLRGHVGWLRALTAWTASDGSNRLASGGNDKTIRVWHADLASPVGSPMTGHLGWLRALAVFTATDGGNRLVSASDDATIGLWDPDTGVRLGPPLCGHSAGVRALASLTGSDRRTWLVSASNDSSVRLWDADTGRSVRESQVGHATGVLAMAAWTDREGCTRLASASDDSVVRLWNADTSTPAGESLAGHTAGVLALAAWTAATGVSYLASAGNDGTIRVWDTVAGAPAGEPLIGHTAGVLTLANWVDPEGAGYLASAGYEGTIRLWRLDANAAATAPLTGHIGTVWALATWSDDDGRTWLASGGNDGTVRTWDLGSWNLDSIAAVTGTPIAQDIGIVWALHAWRAGDGGLRLAAATEDGNVRVWCPDTGEPIGKPFHAHPGGVLALTSWRGSDGKIRLTSSGQDATIRTWFPDTGEPMGPPLTGHFGGVRALTSWARANGDTWLASAGYDGTIRLWDPASGRVVRTIEVGPVAIWGLSDQPAVEDLLGRRFLAQGIAEQLYRPDAAGRPGPAVVAVEGPWGCGKSTLLELVRALLPNPTPSGDSRPRKRQRRLTVRRAARQLCRYEGSPQPPIVRPTAVTGVITAWFNPWAHQSGEQLWAGLAHEIIEAAGDVLYPTVAERGRYWFTRNLSRVDRFALRRALRRRLVSPVLGVVLVATVAPLAIATANLGRPLELFHRLISPGAVALTLAAVAIVIGAVHTGLRYLFGEASNYLPGELFVGPVAAERTLRAADGSQEPIFDPLHRARAGSLYMHQHDIGELLADLAEAGYELIVFMDDLDRCGSAAVVDAFEAINLFLTGFTARRAIRARFVIGFDPAVVAAHLDRVYSGLADPGVALHGEDPSPGWAFLRKLVQLPVLVPAITDKGVDRFLQVATAPPGVPGASPRAAVPPAPVAHPPRVGTVEAPSPPARHLMPDRAPTAGFSAVATRPPPQTVAWRTMEQHPHVQELLRQRLVAQPDRSIREAKRLLNVWQLYVRVLDCALPVDDLEAAIRRARYLVILAEITTRWPALQRFLHAKIDGRRGLQLLAAQIDDDAGWQQVVDRVGITGMPHRPALTALRRLLREYDGKEVADLADLVL